MGEIVTRPPHSDTNRVVQRHLQEYNGSLLAIANSLAIRQDSPTINPVHVRDAARLLQYYSKESWWFRALEIGGTAVCTLGADKFIDVLRELHTAVQPSDLISELAIFVVMAFFGAIAVILSLLLPKRGL